MASEKLTQLSALTTLVDADLIYVVHNTGTLPASFQITVQDLKTTLDIPNIEVNGTPLASQNVVNFSQGSNITITNTSAGIIQIDAASSTPPPVVKVNGTPLITPDPINFVQGSNITVSNPSAGVIQIDAATQGSSTIFQVNGVTLTSSSTINFVQGSNITVTNPSNGDVNFNVSVGAAGLTLVERKTITSSQTTVTFSGLDGDTDVLYLLVIFIVIGASGTGNLEIRPNGVTTNLAQYKARSNSGGQANGNESAWIVSGDPNANGFIFGQAWISAAKSVNSVARQRSYTGDFVSTANSQERTSVYGRWNETTINLTSLDILSQNASQILSGSWMALYKFAQA